MAPGCVTLTVLLDGPLTATNAAAIYERGSPLSRRALYTTPPFISIRNTLLPPASWHCRELASYCLHSACVDSLQINACLHPWQRAQPAARLLLSLPLFSLRAAIARRATWCLCCGTCLAPGTTQPPLHERATASHLYLDTHCALAHSPRAYHPDSSLRRENNARPALNIAHITSTVSLSRVLIQCRTQATRLREYRASPLLTRDLIRKRQLRFTSRQR